MRRGVLLIALMAAVSLAASGCWNPFKPDGDGNGDGDVGDRTSPDNLLKFFAKAYMDKSVERYEEALDLDYSFTFMPEDYDSAGVSEIEPYWGRTEDVERTTLMFTSAQTMSISFDFNLAKAYWYEDTDIILVGGEPQIVDVFTSTWQPDIQITIDRGGSEPTTYWVRDSLVDVKVFQDRLNPSLWTILRIEEYKVR